MSAVWIRSPKAKANKWHRVERELADRMITVARCGVRVPEEADPQHAYQDSAPVDEHGVCKHCLVWKEDDNRAGER